MTCDTKKILTWSTVLHCHSATNRCNVNKGRARVALQVGQSSFAEEHGSNEVHLNALLCKEGREGRAEEEE